MRRMIGAAGQSPLKTAALAPDRSILPGTTEQTQDFAISTPRSALFACPK